MPFQLPGGFALGVASAATQIEGGDRNNSWYDWYQKGRIKDGSDPLVAAEHYARYEADAALMHELGIRHYRLGVEWARLEPERGMYDAAAFAHYRDELRLLKSLGVEPLLTLHHFTNPLWFERMGAFLHPESADIFLSFVEKVVTELGDLVGEYITINEPNVYATLGYFFGEWPPGRKSLPETVRVMNRLCECHVRAYELIHRLRKGRGYTDTKVGYAHHMRVFVPMNPKSAADRLCAKIMRQVFQAAVSKSFLTGKASFPLARVRGAGKGPFCDFHAVNYYSRTAVSGFTSGFLPDAPVNGLGWEVYPDGIALCAKELHALCELPIYVTENGTCDNADAFRSRYIAEHLRALAESGLPVVRYYHWCFTDNFEWLEGGSARFGLVHVDYATQARTVKPSGRFYAELIENSGVTEQMERMYCEAEYPTNAQL